MDSISIATHFIKNNPVTKYLNQVISKHHQKIFPTIVFVFFGGSIIYILRNGLKRKKPVPTKGNIFDNPITILDIPDEVRRRIWTKLDYHQLLKLRLVSGLTKDDVDNFIGVKMRINCNKPELYEFSQTVGLQSCIITNLQEEIGPDFLAEPNLMSELDFREKSSISLNNLVNILNPCINLKQLKLRFIQSSMITEISEIILHATKKMKLLTHLQVFRMGTQTPTDKVLSQVSSPLPPYFPHLLKHIELEIPDISAEQAVAWKHLFEQQIYLESFIVNVGAVHWEYFGRTIMNNPNLEVISLVCAKSYRLGTNDEIRFDWTIFSNCYKLRSLDLACQRTSNSMLMDSMNFHRFPSQNIEEFYISRVIMTAEDVQKVYKEMPKLKHGSMIYIGDAGMETATILAWHDNRQQELERSSWLSEQHYYWDIMAHLVIGLSLIGFVVFSAQNHRRMSSNPKQLATEAD